MFLHHVNDIGQYKTKYLYWHGVNISYTSIILYIMSIALKNNSSSEIANFQRDLFFKEHSGRCRLSILFSILSIIVSVINYSRFWNKIQKRVWQHIWKNVFWIAILYFWTRQPNFFHNVIFNQWGQLSPGSIKDFFWRSIGTP